MQCDAPFILADAIHRNWVAHASGDGKAHPARCAAIAVVIGCNPNELGQSRSGIDGEDCIEGAAHCVDDTGSVGGSGPCPPHRLSPCRSEVTGFAELSRGTHVAPCRCGVDARQKESIVEQIVHRWRQAHSEPNLPIADQPLVIQDTGHDLVVAQGR